jgi:hypothetical protein
MGAWSHEPFGNDAACDWGYDLVESEDLSVIERAISAVINTDGYLDADIGCEALAAIEVIAKLKGKGTQSDAYTEEIDNWVNGRSLVPSDELLVRAGQAIDRILGNESELKELWVETEDDAWANSVEQLRDALSA